VDHHDADDQERKRADQHVEQRLRQRVAPAEARPERKRDGHADHEEKPGKNQVNKRHSAPAREMSHPGRHDLVRRAREIVHEDHGEDDQPAQGVNGDDPRAGRRTGRHIHRSGRFSRGAHHFQSRLHSEPTEQTRHPVRQETLRVLRSWRKDLPSPPKLQACETMSARRPQSERGQCASATHWSKDQVRPVRAGAGEQADARGDDNDGGRSAERWRKGTRGKLNRQSCSQRKAGQKKPLSRTDGFTHEHVPHGRPDDQRERARASCVRGCRQPAAAQRLRRPRRPKYDAHQRAPGWFDWVGRARRGWHTSKGVPTLGRRGRLRRES